MAETVELRKRAADKKRTAAVARQVGVGLSLAADRAMMLECAQELESEATRLDDNADAIETAAEKPLQMAQRHVGEQEARIVRQRALIARLDAAHLPKGAATQMLGTMERLLAVFVEDRARLSKSN